LRRCREAGLIPAGGPGRNGIAAARITVRNAALLLIALAVPVDPIQAPDAARQIAKFRLRARDYSQI
jgi:hypothetical protein